MHVDYMPDGPLIGFTGLIVQTLGDLWFCKEISIGKGNLRNRWF